MRKALLLVVLLLASCERQFHVKPGQRVEPCFYCKRVQTYRLGEIDGRFGITREQVLEAAEKGTGFWEQVLGRELYAYDPEGEIVIDFVYGQGQMMVNQMKEFGAQIDGLNLRIQNLKRLCEEKKTVVESARARFEAEISDVGPSVGTAPAREAGFEERAAAYKEALGRIKAAQEEVDKAVNEANRLIDESNALVEEFNQLSTRLDTMAAGSFVRGDDKLPRLSVYVCHHPRDLTHTFTHEFGHGLGLPDLMDEGAVMFGRNPRPEYKVPLVLSPSDAALLRAVGL